MSSSFLCSTSSCPFSEKETFLSSLLLFGVCLEFFLYSGEYFFIVLCILVGIYNLITIRYLSLSSTLNVFSVQWRRNDLQVRFLYQMISALCLGVTNQKFPSAKIYDFMERKNVQNVFNNLWLSNCLRIFAFFWLDFIPFVDLRFCLPRSPTSLIIGPKLSFAFFFCWVFFPVFIHCGRIKRKKWSRIQ